MDKKVFRRQLFRTVQGAFLGTVGLVMSWILLVSAGIGPYGDFMRAVSNPANYTSSEAFLEATLDGSIGASLLGIEKTNTFLLVPFWAAISVFIARRMLRCQGFLPSRWCVLAALGPSILPLFVLEKWTPLTALVAGIVVTLLLERVQTNRRIPEPAA